MKTATKNDENIIGNLVGKLNRHSDLALAAGLIGILLILLFPVPTWLLDICLAFSVTSSLLILMTTLFITRTLDLSIFPTLLLVTTMLRLSLNIASTRLILSHGHQGTKAAGHIIEAFGGFVMQNNIVIGLIVFLILTLINFVVITKGSGRIAEVAARFSLDAMPGKQMAIDSDLSAGLVDEETAKQRRKDLEAESTFYGTMDGANKFVRGDAIAGILITFINLIGGIIIGTMQKNMSFADALHTYTMLSIGDGLVTQIPSLIISLSTGLLVAKAGVTGTADKAIFGQLGKYPQALWLASAMAGLMGLLPGLPFLPFAVIAGGSAILAYSLKILPIGDIEVAGNLSGSKSSQASPAPSPEALAAMPEDQRREVEEKQHDQQIAKALHMDTIRIELGYNLLSLISKEQGNSLGQQIKSLRRQMAKDLGFIIPSVRIQDNISLEPNKYSIQVKEIDCGEGDLYVDKIMVMNPTGGEIILEGIDATEPAFGLPAKWVEPFMREDAIYNKYTVVDPSTVITTHITEIIKENISDLLTYNETQKLIDEISPEYKKFIGEIVPDLVQISVLQKILQNLLSEMVSIRDLPTIIEAVADGIKTTSNPINLTEIVRSKLARQISYANMGPDNHIPVLTLSTEWEQRFAENLQDSGGIKTLSMAPSMLQDFMRKVNKAIDKSASQGIIPVILTSAAIRPYVRSVIERFKSASVVLSDNEIHPKVRIKTIDKIE